MPRGERRMIDQRAVIDPAARLGEGVTIGPFTVIGPGVQIGDGSDVGPHCVLKGPTTVGKNNRIFQFASIGEIPQDKKFHGEDSTLEIGDGNTIREYVTINRGTANGGGVTRVGNDNWIMAYSHIAHDCLIGNDVILSNAASLAGHVVVGDHVVLGAFSLVHQFCRVGAYCFTAFGSVIGKDVPPYVRAAGHMAKPNGLNVTGLQRRGFTAAELAMLRRAYKLLYKSDLLLEEAVRRIRTLAEEAAVVGPLAEFLAAESQRSILR